MTTKRTLLSEPDSMLAKMFSGELVTVAKDEQGAYMIDRTPDYFKPILNYLRTRELVIDPKISKDGVLAEARYFGIQGLVDQIEKIAEDATRIALEEKEMRLRKLAEEKTEYNLRLLKEGLICEDLIIKKYTNAEGYYGPSLGQLRGLINKINLIPSETRQNLPY